MKSILLFFCFCVLSSFGQTRAIVPRADGEGSVGDGGRAWGTGYFERVYINSTEISPVPSGLTGVNQVAIWNGTNWLTQSYQQVPQLPNVGTNIKRFTDSFPITNIWVAPSTQVMFTAWGATGGGYSGGGGFVEGLWKGPAGTFFEIILGTGGAGTSVDSTRGLPNGGSGIRVTASVFSSNVFHGGGLVIIKYPGDFSESNIIMIAGSSGGADKNNSGFSDAGGPGGGYFYQAQDPLRAQAYTGSMYGSGAYATDAFGFQAYPGSNTANSAADGSFLRGGNAVTNFNPAGLTNYFLAGGGAGYYGGAGSCATSRPPNLSASYGPGGGGSSFVNTQHIVFGFTVRGQPGTAASPAGTDRPTYTSGRGVGANNGVGNSGCAGAMW